MRILLIQLDGKLPNLALMRIASHHAGDEIHLSRDTLRTGDYDKVYASLIFEKTRPKAEELLSRRPDAVVGGTGWDVTSSLEKRGITTKGVDYSLYTGFRQSIGFTQRGCRLKCPFCVVPQKEGKMREEQDIGTIWRGDPWPREIILLDNDFFGQPHWQDRVDELREGRFKVSFCQGINARFLTKETAEAIASLDCRRTSFTRRCVYTAWDNRRDEDHLMRGLKHLIDAGIRPSNIMVYILLGYWPWSDLEDWEYRRRKLRDLGVDPYPMPYERNQLTVGFQRWVCGAYDKRIPWAEWEKADFRPEKLSMGNSAR